MKVDDILHFLIYLLDAVAEIWFENSESIGKVFSSKEAAAASPKNNEVAGLVALTVEEVEI